MWSTHPVRVLKVIEMVCDVQGRSIRAEFVERLRGKVLLWHHTGVLCCVSCTRFVERLHIVVHLPPRTRTRTHTHARARTHTHTHTHTYTHTGHTCAPHLLELRGDNTVKCSCGLVEEKDGTWLQHRTCKSNTLLLPPRQFLAPLSAHLVQGEVVIVTCAHRKKRDIVNTRQWRWA
jgi:hypothetical protein